MKVEWFLRALIALAKEELAKANKDHNGNWPAGQEWHELNGTSQSVFMHKARERAGIPHEEYLAWIRSYTGPEDIEDIWRRAERTTESQS